MKTSTIIVGNIQENVYFYFDENTRVGVVIDPGGEEDKLINFIKDNGLIIKGILITHGHFDHILAVDSIREYVGCDVVAPKEELKFLMDPCKNLSNSMADKHISIKPNLLLNDLEVYSFGDEELKIIYTPGHTPGGACYYSEKEKILFAGDTLFFNSIGRTDLKSGDGELLKNCIKNKLYVLPDDVTVYPGHGRPTTIGHEKVNNPFVRA